MSESVESEIETYGLPRYTKGLCWAGEINSYHVRRGSTDIYVAKGDEEICVSIVVGGQLNGWAELYFGKMFMVDEKGQRWIVPKDEFEDWKPFPELIGEPRKSSTYLSDAIEKVVGEFSKSRAIIGGEIVPESPEPELGTFGDAIEWMKKGNKVCRKSWDEAYSIGICSYEKSKHFGKVCFHNRLGVTGLKEVYNSEDLLATDWMVAE